MERKDEIVTISLEKYEDMKSELETLRKEVKQKTVIKYRPHPIYGYIVLAFMFLTFAFLLK